MGARPIQIGIPTILSSNIFDFMAFAKNDGYNLCSTIL